MSAKTIHEGILSYMKLTDNESRSGYPILKEVVDIYWYHEFKKTKESVVRKWVEVENSIAKMPSSLERLFGVYVVDSCGELAALFEDTAKNVVPKPKKKCKCNSCDIDECLCPTVQDAITQVDVVINDVTYTNKSVTRVLKNGNVVKEETIWVPDYDASGTFTEAIEIPKQTLVCKIDCKPCGCPANSEENAYKLFNCGCMIDYCVPYMRDRYPALYNEFGYYTVDDDTKQVHIYDSNGKKSRLTMVLFVFECNGSDMLIPEYGLKTFIALLDWGRKSYSPSYNYGDETAAKKRYIRSHKEMIRYLNPIPYEWISHVDDPLKGENIPYYRGVHSHFVKPEVVTICAVPEAGDNITNISYSTITSANRWLRKVVGIGDGPVNGISTYQNNSLIGLGNNSSDEVEIFYNKAPMYNWGDVPDISFDKTTGAVTLLNGLTWETGGTLKVELTQ